MKRIISFLIILTVAILCSACINTIAVQELNKKASELMEKGDYQGAIARLQASLDLDDSIFQTRYNLAIAYLKNNQCQKALDEISKTTSMPDRSDEVYYIIGASNNCLADEVYNKTLEDGTKEKIEFQNKADEELAREKFIQYLQEANSAFGKYLELNPNAKNAPDITNLVNQNNEIINNPEAQLQ